MEDEEVHARNKARDQRWVTLNRKMLCFNSQSLMKAYSYTWPPCVGIQGWKSRRLQHKLWEVTRSLIPQQKAKFSSQRHWWLCVGQLVLFHFLSRRGFPPHKVKLGDPGTLSLAPCSDWASQVSWKSTPSLVQVWRKAGEDQAPTFAQCSAPNHELFLWGRAWDTVNRKWGSGISQVPRIWS